MEHDWMALVVFKLNYDQAKKMTETGPPGSVRGFTGVPPIDPERATLTADMVDQNLSHVGCYRCELPWEEAKNRSCPGEPKGYNINGTPRY